MKKYNKTLKTVSIIVILMLMIGAFPVSSIAEKLSEEASLTELYNAKFLTADEILEKGHKKILHEYDDEYTCVIENYDGSKTAYVFDEPIRYKDAYGNYQEINNDIETITNTAQSAEGYAYKNNAGAASVYLPASIKNTPIKLIKDGYSIEYQPIIEQNASNQIQKYDISGSAIKETLETELGTVEAVAYTNGLSGDRLYRYFPTNNGVKEEIYLLKAPDSNVFTYEISSPGLTPEVLGSGNGMVFRNVDHEIVAVTQPMYAKDSYAGERLEEDGHYTENIVMEIEETDTVGRYILTVEVDKSFLNSANTVYPVMIDPSIDFEIDNSNVADTFIRQNGPTEKLNWVEFGAAGKTSGDGITRTYVQMKSLPDISGGTITNAVYRVKEITGYTSNAYVEIYQPSSAWSEASLDWNSAQNLGLGTKYGSSVKVNGAGFYDFNITNLVKQWYEVAGSREKGFMLKMENDTSTGYYRKFGSANSVYNKGRFEFTYLSDTAAPNAVNHSAVGFSMTDDGTTITTKLTFPLPTDNPQNSNSGVSRVELVISNSQGTVINRYNVYPSSGQTSSSVDVRYPSGNSSANTSSDKRHYVRFVVYDAAGNVNTPSDRLALPLNGFSPVVSASTTYVEYPTTLESFTVPVDMHLSSVYSYPVTVQAKVGDSYSTTYTVNSGMHASFNLAFTNVQGVQDGPMLYNTITLIVKDNDNNVTERALAKYIYDGRFERLSFRFPTDNQVVSGTVPITYDAFDSFWIMEVKLEYKKSTEPDSSYVTIAANAGSMATVNWDTSNLEENTFYTLRISANDLAGNYATSTIEVLIGDMTYHAPAISVSPNGDEIFNNTSTSVSVTLPAGINNVENPSEIYLNGKYNMTIGYADSLNLAQIEKDGYYTVVAYSNYTQNGQNVHAYSAPTYTGTRTEEDLTDGVFEYFNQTVINNGKLSLALNPNTLSLQDEYYSTGYAVTREYVYSGEYGPDNITQQNVNMPYTAFVHRLKMSAALSGIWSPTSVDIYVTVYSGEFDETTANWVEITNEEQYKNLNGGCKVRFKFVLATTIWIETPKVDSFSFDVTTVAPRTKESEQSTRDRFVLQTLSPPYNISAMGQVNHSIYLRWEDNNMGDMYFPKTFNIYRSTTENFLPDSEHLIASGLSDPYYYDYSVVPGQKYYYKITTHAYIGGGFYKESMSLDIKTENPADMRSARAVDASEQNKLLGLQDYWSFSSFTTAEGTGYVNNLSGNLVYQATDLISGDSLLALVMRRTYNSQSTSVSALGYGWDFSFNTALLDSFDTNGVKNGMILKDGDGSIHKFTLNSDGTYSPPSGVFITLTVTDDPNSTSFEGRTTYTLTRKDGIIYTYNTRRQLTRFTDTNGNYIQYTYDARGNIHKIYGNVRGIDEAVTFGYSEDVEWVLESYSYKCDMISTMTDREGRTIYFSYTELSDTLDDIYALAKVSYIIPDETEVKTEYEYASSYFKVKKADGTVTTFHLDENGKVTQVNQPENFEYRFDYVNSNETHVYRMNTTGEEPSYTNAQRSRYVFSNGLLQHEYDALDRRTTYTYNSNKQILTVWQEGWHETEPVYTFEYDVNGNITKSTLLDGSYVQYLGYNSFNKPTTVKAVNKLGQERITTYTYDSKGNQLTCTDPTGKTTSTTYNTVGLPLTVTDRYGGITTYTYTDKYQLETVKDALNNVVSTQLYDEDENYVTGTKDALNNTSSYGYDVLGRKLYTEYPDGTREKWAYDEYSRVTLYTDRTGNATAYQYDTAGVLIKTVNSDGTYSRLAYTYDPLTNDLITREYAGTASGNELLLSTYYYDKIGNVIRAVSGGTDTRYAYDTRYLLTEVYINDASGNKVHSTTYTYDLLGRQLTATNIDLDNAENSLTTTSVYDAWGELSQTVDNAGNAISYTYDVLGRMTSVTQTVNGTAYTTTYAYDILTTLNGITCVKSTTTDAEGRIKAVYTDLAGNTLRNEDLGNPDDTASRVSTFTYNAAGWLLSGTMPDGSTTSYTYDNMGRQTVIRYDTDNYIETVYTTTPTAVDGVQYNLADRTVTTIEHIKNSWDTQARTYSQTVTADALGRTTRVTQNHNGAEESVFYRYDEYGRTYEIDYLRDGQGLHNILRYTYDSVSRLSTVWQNTTDNTTFARVRDYVYGSDGALAYTKDYRNFMSASTAAYLETEYTRNSLGQLVSVKLTDKTATGGTLLEEYTLEYNNRGLISKERQDRRFNTPTVLLEKTYTYDEIGRTVSHTSKVGNETDTYTYTFDKVGNRLTETLTKTDSVLVRTFNYDTTGYDRLQTVYGRLNNDTEELMSQYTYDTNGNMLTDKEYSSSTEYTLETYQYDKAGRMARQTQTDHNNNTLTQLTHYYIGEQRVEKLSGENIGSRYYYTGGALLFTAAVYNHERTTENIVALDGQVIASKRFEGTFDGNYYFYYYDIRGSVSGIFGPSSEVVKDYQYTLYGEITEGGNADFENEIGFTGSITDETGLNYMHARFYNSDTGRFISEDSFGGYMAQPWTQNLYSYCGNNPVSMIDPSGHCSYTALEDIYAYGCGYLIEMYGGSANQAGLQSAYEHVSRASLHWCGPKCGSPEPGKFESPAATPNATSVSALFREYLKYDIEMGHYSLRKYGQFDSNGKLIAIKPYYSSGDAEQYKNYTVGFGTYMNEDRKYDYLKSKYGNNWMNAYISIEDCNYLFNADLEIIQARLNKTLQNLNVSVNQNQFDALMTEMYFSGGLRSNTKSFLKTNISNMSKEEQRNGFYNALSSSYSGYKTRNNMAADIFIGIYNIHPLNKQYYFTN